MRLVVQRVSSASVSAGERVVGSIEKGLFVLVGIGQNDSRETAETLAEKLARMRIMADEDGKMNLSSFDAASPILVVSQFTLYADTSKGNRPSFVKAALPEHANRVYEYFVEVLRGLGIKVQTGSFGEYMAISLALDGPVTIIMEV